MKRADETPEQWYWVWSYRPVNDKSLLDYIKAASPVDAVQKFLSEYMLPHREQIHVVQDTGALTFRQSVGLAQDGGDQQ